MTGHVDTFTCSGYYKGANNMQQQSFHSDTPAGNIQATESVSSTTNKWPRTSRQMSDALLRNFGRRRQEQKTGDGASGDGPENVSFEEQLPQDTTIVFAAGRDFEESPLH